MGLFTAGQIVTSFVGGAVADRISKKWIIVVTECIGAALTALVWLYWPNPQDMLHVLYFASASLGVLSAFHLPALQMILPEIVKRDSIPHANAVRAISNNVIRLMGPLLGALVVSIAGRRGPFLVDSVTFVISGIAMIFTLTQRIEAHEKSARTPFVRDIVNGLAFAWQTPWVRTLLVFSSFLSLVINAPFELLVPILIHKRHLPEAWVGYIAAGQGAGAVVANFAARHRNLTPAALYRWIFAISICSGGGLTVIGLSVNPIMMVTGGLILGFGLLATTYSHSVMQQALPQHMLGRIFSTSMFFSFVLLMFGYQVFGISTTVFPISVLLISSGVLAIAAAVIAYFLSNKEFDSKATNGNMNMPREQNRGKGGI